MEKRNSQIEHGQPMEHTRGLLCTCDSGVARCQSQHQYHIRGEFNNASALGRSLYWCQALHIMNKDRYQSTSARRALALLNSPLANVFDLPSVLHGRVSLAGVNQICVIHKALNGCKNIKGSLKDCFKNVNMTSYSTCFCTKQVQQNFNLQVSMLL